MSTAKHKSSRVIAFLLAIITLLSVIPIMPVSAETLSDGKSTFVTIKLNETHKTHDNSKSQLTPTHKSQI